MKKGVLIICLVLVICRFPAWSQEPKTKNVIIVTLDGYRWQELYRGADPAILKKSKYVKDTLVWKYSGASEKVNRETLMPFFWQTIATQGQLYGNRQYKNKVNCTNTHLISYPGYSEMLVGFPTSEVSSNRKVMNPNATVLEHIHGHDNFRNRVAAFSTWDAFPYILREETSGIMVNSGNELAEGNLTEKEMRLNERQHGQTGLRPDSITFSYAMEFLKSRSPRVLFISFDGTDHHAHAGHYDEYLKSAHEADAMIAKLWQWVQSTPGYKDETTLFITTDHGRGSGKNNWRNHRLAAPGSGQTWFAVMGPDTPPFGEMKFKAKYYQKQVAKTIAAFLGLQYEHHRPVGEVVQTMLAVPGIATDAVTADSND